MPPLLAFTTEALGGFRGLISNYLWIRANNLQLAGKYFEASQLANWITDLEPRFAQVWSFQAWNMAYNISVKFKENAPGDFSDRWNWVLRGIELLRDRGRIWNPHDPYIYWQLGWIFQHKMGQNLDDGNMYYKEQWAKDMAPFFGPHGTNFEDLIHPQTAEERTNAYVLRNKYKINPVFAQQVNEEYGPLDWRLPEAHAIYWYALGLKMATNNPGAPKPTDFNMMQLRRGIFQSEQAAFRQGRIIENPFTHEMALGPELALIPKANDSYLQMYAEEKDQGQRDEILRGQRNFVRDAIYFLYVNNRIADAAKWFKYFAEKFPDQHMLDNNTNSLPRNMTLDDYAMARVQADLGDTSQERTTSDIQGLLERSYLALALGQNDDFASYQLLAQKIYDRYRAKTEARVKLPSMDNLKREVLNQLLDPQNGLPFNERARIRTQLNMPAETVSTNVTPPAVVSTNAAPTSTNSLVPAAGP